jgi:hypothetical protein
MSEKKPRGKPFESKDTRRNTRGQRNAAAVATAAEIRALYVQVLHEQAAAPVSLLNGGSNLELIVRCHVNAALTGSQTARETMFDRIFGKTLTETEHAGRVEIHLVETNARDEQAV